MLVDTTFWVHLVGERRRGQRSGPAHTFLAQHRADELRVSIVTWGELAEWAEHSSEVDLLLGRVRVLGLPAHVAWQTSRIQRGLAQRLGENDAWIAGTARTWGLRLVTRDAAFRRVPNLRVVAY